MAVAMTSRSDSEEDEYGQGEGTKITEPLKCSHDKLTNMLNLLNGIVTHERNKEKDMGDIFQEYFCRFLVKKVSKLMTEEIVREATHRIHNTNN